MTNVEIERRWIVNHFGDNIKAHPSKDITQGYLDLPGQMRVRIYSGDGRVERAELTKKSGKGIKRNEINADISVEAAKMLLETTDLRIEKTRYYRDGWEIDFFHGKLEGLILAEKELGSVDEPCPIPGWLNVGPEVTDTLTNKQLALTNKYLSGQIDPVSKRTKKIPRVVLTGGPCGGKSTLIEKIRADKRFHCVPELATVLMGQFGIMPDGDPVEFQRTLHKIQRSIEDGAIKQATKAGKSVVVFDRGTLDSAGFIEGGISELETVLGIKRIEEFNNYDHVIMLPVPPKDIYDIHKGNNPVRRETWEEARAAETKLIDAWKPHSGFMKLSSERLDDRFDALKMILGLEKMSWDRYLPQVVDNLTSS